MIAPTNALPHGHSLPGRSRSSMTRRLPTPWRRRWGAGGLDAFPARGNARRGTRGAIGIGLAATPRARASAVRGSNRRLDPPARSMSHRSMLASQGMQTVSRRSPPTVAVIRTTSCVARDTGMIAMGWAPSPAARREPVVGHLSCQRRAQDQIFAMPRSNIVTADARRGIAVIGRAAITTCDQSSASLHSRPRAMAKILS